MKITVLAALACLITSPVAAQPATPWVWSLSNTSLRATWTLPDSTASSEYRYRLAGGPDWTVVAAGASTSATLTGLSAGADYDVQVRAGSAGQTSEWSASAHGRTLEGPGLGNLTYQSSEVGRAVAWVDSSTGVPAGTGNARPFGTAVGAMVNGYFLTVFAPNGGMGPGGFLLYDVSNPRAATLARTVYEPEGRTAEIREAHSIGVARVAGSTYVAVQSSRGIEFWDFTDIDNIRQVSKLRLPGVRGGDYFGAAWQLWWQAPYVYVAASSQGLYVVDASDPARPYVARMSRGRSNPVPPGEYGGFKVGPVFSIGNHLVLASMHSVDGWASLDISDPLDPMLLARTPDMPLYYSACFDGKRMFSAVRNSGRMLEYDLSDPGAFRQLSTTGQSSAFLYCAMQDDLLFQGGPHVFTKFDIGAQGRPRFLGRVSVDSHRDREHGQVTFLGNLVFVGDDHGVGSAIVPHSASLDQTAPSVVAVSPRDGATGQAVTSRIGIGFSDSVLLESVTGGTLRLIDDAGEVVEGTYSAQLGIVNFAPAAPLKPAATYTVLLPANGVADYAGNTIESEFRSTFTTGPAPSAAADPVAGGIDAATLGAGSTVGVASDFIAVEQAGAAYHWDFGDGSSSGTSSSARANHAYASAGHYTVVLTVTLGGGRRTHTFVRTVSHQRTASAATSSSSIVGGGDLVFNVNPHNGTVTAIHRVGLNKEWETRVGRGPRTLALDSSGRVWVAVREDDKLVCLNADGSVQGEIPVGRGRGPFGIAFVPGTDTGLVTLQHSGEVLRFDAGTMTILGRRAVNQEPRGIAVATNGDAYVTQLRSTSEGVVSKVDATTLQAVSHIKLPVDSTTVDTEDAGRGRPNYLTQVAVSPDGRTAWVAAKKDNVLRGEFRDGLALTHDSTVRAMAAVLDLGLGRELIQRRVDFNDRAFPRALAFSPRGDYVFVAMQGSNTVEIVDAYSGANRGEAVSGGKAPQGIWIDEDGRQAFVYNFTTRNVSVYDIGDVLDNVAFEPALVRTVATVASDVFDEGTRLGLQIFNDASDPRMSRDGYISCASCHLEGGEDGAVWDFTDRGEGLRNTISLLGRKGTAHGKLHWTANFDEVQDFENDIRNAFGGTGFLSDTDFGRTSAPHGPRKAGLSRELDALAKYLASLHDFGRSPHRTQSGELTDAARLGRRVFGRLGCNACHRGADFTDGLRHDVGTVGPGSGKASGQPFGAAGIDTPTLLGVWATAPYFHDGSVATLDAVVRSGHGETGDLPSAEREALVAFLASLERPAVDFAQIRVQARDQCWEAEPKVSAQLTLPACDASQPKQRWRLDAAGGVRPMLDDGLCLTVDRVDRSELRLGSCDGSDRQRWRLADGVFFSSAFPDNWVVSTRIPSTVPTDATPLSVKAYNARIGQLWHLRHHGQVPRKSTEPALSGLSLSGVDLAFQPDVSEYTASVGAEVGETVVEASARIAGTTVEIVDHIGSDSSHSAGGSGGVPLSRSVSLLPGANRIEVEVVAEDDQISRVHGVTVTRGAGLLASPRLRDLSLSGIDIAFDSSMPTYLATVATSLSSTTVTATAADEGASVTIDDGNGSTDGTTRTISLATGINTITVTVAVTAGGVATTGTYTVTVTRAAPPVVSIAAGASPVPEGTAATFTVTLDEAALEALTVAVSVTESSSALSGTPPASVAFAKGETSATLSVPTARDSVVEAASTVTATVSSGTGYTVGTGSSATVTVEDDDAATFTVSADAEAISEGESATLTVAISNGVTFAEDQTVALALSGTASASDYTGVPATLTLPAGASSVTAALAAAVDQEEEEGETVTVTASHAGSPIGSATVTINSISHDATLKGLSLSGIDIGTFSGAVTSYTANVAHSAETTTVTATASHSAATVSIEPGAAVSLAVGANEIIVTVTAEDGATANTYAVTVTRASLPEATIAAFAGPVPEGTAAAFTVSLDRAATEALTVAVAVTESGSMLSGTPPASVAFETGSTVAPLTVPTAADSVVEADSTVTATLISGTGYTVGTASSASLTVEDDDAATFTVSAEPAEIAEGETATIAVAIADGVTFAEDRTVALTVSGTASASDHTGVPATLTLAAGASAVTAALVASADQEEEEPETVTVTASLEGSSSGSATVTIHSPSNDATLGALSLSGIDIGTFSGDVTSYTATVAHSVETATVTATASHAAATVSIEPGAAVSLEEGANEITVTVTAENGTTKKTYTVTVTRSGPPEAAIAAGTSPVTEGTAAAFTVTLGAAAPEALTVAVSVTESGSMLSGAPPVSVAFAQGDTTATLSVPTAADSVVEAGSTVTATLAAGTGYTVGSASSAAVTVDDDDTATFTVSADAEAIDEGESATLTVAISNAVTFAQDQTVSLAVSGTASASDYTGIPATLTLAAGASSVTAALAAAVDQEEEADETVTVTASHGGSPAGSATVTIHSISHDATLKGLSLSGIEIGTFSGAVTSYTANVAHSVETTTVTAAASHSAATVSIEPGAAVNLTEGANEITVTVTAEDGTATKTYTVTVTRAALPVVSIAAVASRVPEGESAEFRVSRTGPTTEALAVQVGWSTSKDPTVRLLTMRLRAGQSSKVGWTQMGDNTVIREDITVTWTLQEGEGHRISGESASATVVVEENDVAEFALSVDPAEIAEGESATVTVAITNGVRFRRDQAIALSVSGTASGSDYTGVPETLTLRAYGTSATAAVLTAAVDQEDEGEETVTITAALGDSSIGSATVTINSISHDATLGSLSLSGIDIGTFSGGVTSYTANVAHSVGTTTVTATASHSAATVSIEPGAAVSLEEGANEITVTVTAEDGTTTKAYTVTVTRAARPVVSVAAVASRVSEGEPARFTLSRTGPTTEHLDVQIRTWSTYTARDSTSTLPLRVGKSTAQPYVRIHDNAVIRDDITVRWTLLEGAGYRVSADAASATVVLEENDVAEFALAADPTEVAEGESATIQLEITNGVTYFDEQEIALDFAGSTATKNTDFTVAPASLRLRAGASSVAARITAAGDAVEEDDETVAVAAALDGTTVGTATLTIADSAAAPLTARFVSMPEAHDGAAAFTFELRFSAEVDIGYETLRDTAFNVTGGGVRSARRLVRASNLRWQLTAEPASDADVVLALPATTDCEAAGAVCTAGGIPLSRSLEATVTGPGSEDADEGFPLSPENSSPSGIWSDGETAWVADLNDARLYAYRRSDGERQPARDIATDAAPMGLWSDGGTLWVAGLGGGLRAHRLADGARLAARDLALEANATPAGVWSDGETAWVSAWLGDTVHAYRLKDGQRRADRDIQLAGENLLPVGVWSDGGTLWVADWTERMYAYRLADGQRVPQRDIPAGAADTDPSGLWSGGRTLLSTSWSDGEVRAHRMPAVEAGPVPDRTGSRADPAGSVPAIADPGLRTAIRRALGKAPGEPVSAVELARLESLSARNSGVRDLAGLEAAASLKELDLGYNPLADLRPLASLPALESLNLDGAALDLAPLASLTGLRRLSIRHNGIDDLQALALLAGLAELDVGDNRIEDLRPLAGLTRLAVLRADRNRIADLWPLASLTGLETLELGSNRVRDLQPLAGMERLRTLRLAENGLSELHPLSGLKGLTELGLAGNAVESVRALADMGGLRRLDLRGNSVGDLRPLRGLSSLVWLHVGGSRIEDLAPLEGLDGLTVAGRDDLDPPFVGDDHVQRPGSLGRSSAGQ